MDRLCDLSPGEQGTVASLCTQGPMRRRLLELGLIEGTRVECLCRSPGGDPTAYRIRRAVIALRRKDAMGVMLVWE